jgi:transmembrane sensor
MLSDVPQNHRPIPERIQKEASTWLARRDRGLTPAEQDEYIQWLRADSRHTEAMTQHAAALERMMQLYEWQPSHDTVPNPDLFLARRFRRWMWTTGLAAAAALIIGGLAVMQAPRSMPMMDLRKTYIRVNERLALPDGSRVELKDGTRVIVQYSENERRVKLTGGEAHFSVWKDKARPFIVEVSGVEVRAVGTAFNVRLDPKAVEVLVTEGRVEVGHPDVLVTEPVNAPLVVSVGERAVVPLEVIPTAPPVVTPVTAEEITHELAWQEPRLQFSETPLIEAVTEFNRLNRQQIVIADRSLDSLKIGGTFRPDNVDGFVRLLGSTLPLRAEKTADDRTVLHAAP